MKLLVRALHEVHAAGLVLAGGEHDLAGLTAQQVRMLGAAAAAGVLEILETDNKAARHVDALVESDEDSLARLGDAIANGRWQDGNLEQEVAKLEQLPALLTEQIAEADRMLATQLEEDEREAWQAWHDGQQARLAQIPVRLAAARAALAAHRGESA